MCDSHGANMESMDNAIWGLMFQHIYGYLRWPPHPDVGWVEMITDVSWSSLLTSLFYFIGSLI